jgi:hypothetical protein
MTETPGNSTHQVALRRSPRLRAFVLIFAVIGFFGTLIATGLYPADPSVGFIALFAYFALYGVTASIFVGVLVWLVLDIRSRKRARVVLMEDSEEN